MFLLFIVYFLKCLLEGDTEVVVVVALSYANRESRVKRGQCHASPVSPTHSLQITKTCHVNILKDAH